MGELSFGIVGAGFWSQYQLAAWRELNGAQCVAICDVIPERAEQFANRFGIDAVYSNAKKLMSAEKLDFVDIITDVDSHPNLVRQAIEHRLPVICQKPLASSLALSREMHTLAIEANVPLLVHENWRWQTPLRTVKQIVESGRLGTIVRGRIDYANSFPVFENQPFLKSLKRFILTDIGTHILDVARFLWGEASELYCQTRKIHADINGEDVATVMMRMDNDVTVTCNMSYASKWEFDRFPETFVAIEGSEAGVTLGPNFEIRIADHNGFEIIKVPPPWYEWADPAYHLIHASIVECHRNLLSHLNGSGKAETTSEDNLRTLELVFASYDSAESNSVIRFEEKSR